MPEDVEDLVRRLLAKPPAQRPNDTHEVAAELARSVALLRRGAHEPRADVAAGAPVAPMLPADDVSTVYTSHDPLPAGCETWVPAFFERVRGISLWELPLEPLRSRS